MKTVHTTMGYVEWLLLVTLSVLWGGSFSFVRVAVKVLPPLTIEIRLQRRHTANAWMSPFE
jgi:hypothetical protein